ncbi:hypothetical protein I316_02411 [Kwoniella heveanensis BCC8398]|uniref:Uncharacterized protein n=1 Tax=Kwoniella heveanensis BCC8398 TaxID=1296120 RepID=A0A1B9GY30_9TREE|nr:hypothetical protein I316_02411 [Kwoniella heveanensis BCC8398]
METITEGHWSACTGQWQITGPEPEGSEETTMSCDLDVWVDDLDPSRLCAQHRQLSLPPSSLDKLSTPPSSTGVGGTVSGFQSRLKRCLGYDSVLDKETKQKTHRECKLDIMVDEHDPVNICSGHQENLSICKEYVETRTPSTSDWLTRGVAAFKTAQEDASRQRQDLAKMRRSDPSFVPTSSPASLVWRRFVQRIRPAAPRTRQARIGRDVPTNFRSSTRISDRRPKNVASTQESTLARSEEGMVEGSTSESHIQESETSAMVNSQPAAASCATVDEASSVPHYSEYSLGYDYVRGAEEYFDEEFETIQAARGE